MFKQLDNIGGHTLALHITGEISAEEHHRLDLLIRHYVDQWQRIRLLIVFQHYPSLSSAEALFEDLRMIKLHADHIDKMALVGDRPWDRTYLGLFGLFSKLQTDYFQMDQFEEARQWLNEGSGM